MTKQAKIETIKTEYIKSFRDYNDGRIDDDTHEHTGEACLRRLQRMGCKSRMYAWAILIPTDEWATKQAVAQIMAR